MFKKKAKEPAAKELAPAPVARETKTFTLTDFEVMTTLGTGTFGRVRLVKYLAEDTFYALKILKKSEIIRLKQVTHIKSEITILKMIQHPFVVNLIGHFQDERKLYMVIEYVHGGELFSHLRREGRFSDDHARYYAAEIVLAFGYMHSMNIVYRDLKPENLLISTQGHMKITDFGFAKQIEDRTWTLCGTPEYLAPEIIQSKGHDKGVDWWALGILCFEMLAGYPPFYDENPFGIYQKILAGKIEFPRQFDAKAKDLIKKLLNNDRTKRLGSSKNGVEDIKKSKWFSKTDFSAVYQCSLPAPYIPEVSGDGDTHHFDPYPDSVDDMSVPLTGKDRENFVAFDSL
jgi:serine/threonine protein kinase